MAVAERDKYVATRISNAERASRLEAIAVCLRGYPGYVDIVQRYDAADMLCLGPFEPSIIAGRIQALVNRGPSQGVTICNAVEEIMKYYPHAASA